MKKLILILLCGFLIQSGYAQVKASDVFEKLGKMPDQFDNLYDTKVTDKLTLIYIPGTNNPFEKIYNKRKAAKTIGNVVLVGGFKEMMNSMSYDTKKDHLQDALSIRYKKGSTILIDMDSELAQLLSISGYSIIKLSRNENKITEVNDYGFDRVEFFKNLGTYEEKQAN